MRIMHAVLSFLPALLPTVATASCRLALALGLDVSGSVDAAEFQQQTVGLAAALQSDSVRDALLGFPDRPVALMAFEWSAVNHQKIIADWQVIDSAATLDSFAARIATHPRQAAPYPTSIGGAMEFAAAALNRSPACDRQVLDLSGDGKSNNWPPPERVRDTPAFAQITVNALVIGSDRPLGGNNLRTELEELDAYFTANVIHGSGAFVERAAGYAQYEEAMTRKLLRELEGQAFTYLTPADAPAAIQ